MEKEQVPLSRKRRRPPKACEQCRQRKVRCDQLSPCSQCVRLKIDICTYDPQTILKRHGGSVRAPVGFRTEGAPPTPASSTDLDGILNAKTSHSTGVNTSIVRSPVDIPQRHLIDAKQAYQRSSDLLEDQPLHFTGSSAQPPYQPPASLSGVLHGTVTKTRLLGRSHWINIVQEFTFIHEIQKQLVAGNKSNAKALLEKCKSLGRTVKSNIYSNLKILPNIRDHLPVKETADGLLENYFRAFESCYRVLHGPSFRRQYAQFWASPDSASQAFVIQLLLVLAIGTCVSDEDAQKLHISALNWIHAAQSWLSSPFMEKSRLTVTGVQAQCLMLIAREANSVGPDLIWISAGSLVRSAILIGLHREPSYFTRLSPCQSELRRRLWATVMEISLQSAMTAGGSPMLSPDSYDCRPPSNLDDADLDPESGTAGTPKPDSVYTQSSIQVALMQTMSLRCRIAQMLNDFRVEQSFSETLQIGAKLTTALQTLSIQLRSSMVDHESRNNNTALMMYELMTYRFLVSLHQTYAFKALGDPMYYFSRKVCLDISLLIGSRSFPASGFVSTSSPDFDKILDRCSGSPKSIVSVAFLIIMLELTTQLQQNQASLSIVSDNLVREEMFRGLSAYADCSLRRLEWGETNPKGYLFSMIGIAQLRALEKGESTEEATFRVGIQVVELCIDVLQKHLDNSTAPQVPDPFDKHLAEDFGMPFGDDFGWDDWDPSFSLGPPDLLFPMPLI